MVEEQKTLVCFERNYNLRQKETGEIIATSKEIICIEKSKLPLLKTAFDLWQEEQLKKTRGENART